MTRRTDAYFERFGFCARQIPEPPAPGLSLIVVIPCFNEPNLIDSLGSLRTSKRPDVAHEVIVVVNSAADADGSIIEQNERTLRESRAWIEDQPEPKLTVHLIDARGLPPRHAGVGLARKIGMDEALRRFDDAGMIDSGVILCFDADCTSASNYLRAVDEHFRAHQMSPACSIYFEHPLEGELVPEIYEAIAAYELHLRYYIEALRYTGFPHAYHAIGSSMAVRARAYMEQGGMNRRQAGEDFYFLHKLIPLGDFTELNSTAVYPSPRPSNRVPFGTGRAVSEWLQEPGTRTYPLPAFDDLRVFVQSVPSLITQPDLQSAPASIRTFLGDQDFDAALAGIRGHTSTLAAFTKRFFRWFDGFRAMKFVHHARDHFYGDEEVEIASAKLLERFGRATTGSSTRELLFAYRRLNRGIRGKEAAQEH
jgi:glycosyltransferase involved in cell wall biosynthesis